MKTKLFFTTILCVVSLLYSCNDTTFEEAEERVEAKKELTDIANDVVSEFNIDAKIASVELISNNKMQTKSQNTDGIWDIENSASFKFVTSTGKELISTSIPLKSNPNTKKCIVETNGIKEVYILDFVFDEEKETMVYKINYSLSSPQTKSLSNWMSCMENALDSHIGVIITVSGVAGGLGCVPCAAVAGFYTGVISLGCLG